MDDTRPATAVEAEVMTMEDVFQQALEDVQTTDTAAVRELIAERMREIRRLKALVAKAERELAQLRSMTLEEAAMLTTGEGITRPVRRMLGSGIAYFQ